jgi:hypothetical protein
MVGEEKHGLDISFLPQSVCPADTLGVCQFSLIVVEPEQRMHEYHVIGFSDVYTTCSLLNTHDNDADALDGFELMQADIDVAGLTSQSNVRNTQLFEQNTPLNSEQEVHMVN